LVLGSGGARGLAHIGVIHELMRSNFEIKAIAGSSMGALIGGIYAMGKLDVYTNWVTALQRSDVLQLVDLSFGRNGLIKGNRIIELLKSMIGNANIEDLPIRFTAVATDLEAEAEEWFRDGPLFDAIRASISIPTIFTPYRYRGREFLDGSLVNPLPISATLEDKADLTIAVILNGKPENKAKPQPAQSKNKNDHRAAYQRRIAQFIDEYKPRRERQQEDTLGMFDIIVKSMSIMERTITKAQLKTHSPDIVIEIPIDACNFYEFYRAEELIELGRQKTEAAFLSRRPGGITAVATT